MLQWCVSTQNAQLVQYVLEEPLTSSKLLQHPGSLRVNLPPSGGICMHVYMLQLMQGGGPPW
jgi:hypothetical protein